MESPIDSRLVQTRDGAVRVPLSDIPRSNSQVAINVVPAQGSLSGLISNAGVLDFYLRSLSAQFHRSLFPTNQHQQFVHDN